MDKLATSQTLTTTHDTHALSTRQALADSAPTHRPADAAFSRALASAPDTVRLAVIMMADVTRRLRSAERNQEIEREYWRNYQRPQRVKASDRQ